MSGLVAGAEDFTAAARWAVLALLCLILMVIIRWPTGDLVRNERIKLAATALNNLGVAALIYGWIVPHLGGAGVGNAAFLGFAVGIVFIGLAQFILGLLRKG